jgi:hypothetical protein
MEEMNGGNGTYLLWMETSLPCFNWLHNMRYDIIWRIGNGPQYSTGGIQYRYNTVRGCSCPGRLE